MGVVRTKSGLASTTRTTRDQLIIFIDIITKKKSFSRGSPTEDCSDWSKLIAVSSHYMENSMPYLACLPVGGASLANDDVMRGGGAAEIGMRRKQVR